jgi:hypothetical protein
MGNHIGVQSVPSKKTNDFSGGEKIMKKFEVTESAQGTGITIYNSPGRVFLSEPEQRALIEWIVKHRWNMIKEYL